VGNRFVGLNYLPGNPRMATPPEFWLQRLYDFDAELVVFPSIHVPYAYVLARRARLSAGLSAQALAQVVDQPDTKFCLTNGLVPVTMIYRYSMASWSIDNIIQSLKARDIWAHGGGEKVADLLDNSEAAQAAKARKENRDDMWNRSGDAWRSYQARTGQRTRPTVGQKDPTGSRSTGTNAPLEVPSHGL
jgi:hypothetical protein